MWVTGQSVQNSFYGIYNKAIGRNLLKKVGAFSDILHDHYSNEHGVNFKDVLSKIKTVTEYDENVTSKVFGYKTRDNYYDQASSIHKVPHITVPTFILLAKDDPVIGEGCIDHDICKANPNVLLGVTDHGGHLGYFETFMSTG